MTTRTVSPRDLKNLLHDGAEIALLDVREEGQFGEGHLLFATPLPYSKLETSIQSAKKALLALSKNDGHWCFELEADCTIPAEYDLTSSTGCGSIVIWTR